MSTVADHEDRRGLAGCQVCSARQLRSQPLGGGLGMARSGILIPCGPAGTSFADRRTTRRSSGPDKIAGCITRKDCGMSSSDDMWQAHLPASQQGQCPLPPRVRHIGQLQACIVWLPLAFQGRGGARKDHAHNTSTDNLMARNRNSFTLPPFHVSTAGLRAALIPLRLGAGVHLRKYPFACG